jgi:hypothetical protein
MLQQRYTSAHSEVSDRAMVGRVVAATGDVRLVCRSWFANLSLLLHHLLTQWVIYACWALYTSFSDG